MDDPAPSLREQGSQAQREGKIDAAVDLLARAVMSGPQDAEAQAFLGVAYSQKGLHPQAKEAPETAAILQPQNVQYRLNLDVALEQAGVRAVATSAFSEALQIDPTHAQARARTQPLAAQGVAPAPAAPPPVPVSPIGRAERLTGGERTGGRR
jgi:Flp pilus assembly protein TadD